MTESQTGQTQPQPEGGLKWTLLHPLAANRDRQIRNLARDSSLYGQMLDPEAATETIHNQVRSKYIDALSQRLMPPALATIEDSTFSQEQRTRQFHQAVSDFDKLPPDKRTAELQRFAAEKKSQADARIAELREKRNRTPRSTRLGLFRR